MRISNSALEHALSPIAFRLLGAVMAMFILTFGLVSTARAAEGFELTLEPTNAVRTVGEQHEVTATLVDTSSGEPVVGATIQFVASGLGFPTISGTDDTDVNGEATFAFTRTTAGIDTIDAIYNPDGVLPPEAFTQANVTWGENRAPTAVAGGPYLGAVNTAIQLDGTGSSDPDGHTLTYHWTSSVDDPSLDDGSFDNPSSPTPTFSATSPAVYTLTLRVCDQFTACDTDETYVAVFDPDAGFVTGGGWIDSPTGACGPAAPTGVCDGDPTGGARFAFTSKYQNGSTAPNGQTRFVFSAGNLDFESTSYDWLVVQGSTKAQFRGTGTINGAGNYNFAVTIYDADNNGGGSADGLRIRITDPFGGLVYDNRWDAGNESSNPSNTQPITRGEIVIHTK